MPGCALVFLCTLSIYIYALTQPEAALDCTSFVWTAFASVMCFLSATSIASAATITFMLEKYNVSAAFKREKNGLIWALVGLYFLDAASSLIYALLNRTEPCMAWRQVGFDQIQFFQFFFVLFVILVF